MSGLIFEEAALGYASAEVLSGVRLGVHAGEVVGLVGPNGAGKTTLIRAVSGGADVLGGAVTIDGRRATDLSARERARLVGVLPQNVVGDVPFSGLDFVMMGRYARAPRLASANEADRQAAERAMERTDTTALAAEPIDILSGGDLQRLALAQALAQEPSVLLLDEPTSHLDVNHRLQILELCRGLADEGMAVLGVFHDLDLAARYADRIAVVANGTLFEDGRPEQVLRPELIREVFKVRAVVHRDLATQALSVTPLIRDDDVAPVARGRVMVVGGSGHGAWLVGELVRRGWEVTLAAVSAGDTDHAVARVLGVEAVALPPFGGVGDADEKTVRERASGCRAAIVSQTPFGRANVGNLRAVADSGVEAILVGAMDESRDYTEGEAASLWRALSARGAVAVDDEHGALEALERMDS